MVSGGTAQRAARDARECGNIVRCPTRMPMQSSRADPGRFRNSAATGRAPEAIRTRIKAAIRPGARCEFAGGAAPACAPIGGNDVHAVSYGTEAGLFQGRNPCGDLRAPAQA